MTEASARQPAPIPNDQPSIWQLVIADMKEREKFGIEKYKTVLQINDGRDHLVDIYQEALDFVVYIKQEIEQRKHDAQNWSGCAATRMSEAESLVLRAVKTLLDNTLIKDETVIDGDLIDLHMDRTRVLSAQIGSLLVTETGEPELDVAELLDEGEVPTDNEDGTEGGT